MSSLEVGGVAPERVERAARRHRRGCGSGTSLRGESVCAVCEVSRTSAASASSSRASPWITLAEDSTPPGVSSMPRLIASSRPSSVSGGVLEHVLQLPRVSALNVLKSSSNSTAGTVSSVGMMPPSGISGATRGRDRARCSGCRCRRWCPSARWRGCPGGAARRDSSSIPISTTGDAVDEADLADLAGVDAVHADVEAGEELHRVGEAGLERVGLDAGADDPPDEQHGRDRDDHDPWPGYEPVPCPPCATPSPLRVT